VTALDDLLEALQTARSTVFRLEAHQDYPDDELWQAHLRGERWQQDPDLAWWSELVATNQSRGVTMSRVRVVTGEWTPYTRWEIEEHYPHNVLAGEDVRLARAQRACSHADFWLVDDERAWWLEYDEAGTMTVTEASPGSLPSLVDTRNRSLAIAESMSAAAS
jgi:hypothetical protein